MKQLIISICIIFFYSCEKMPTGYKYYQTFDEYKLIGVNDKNYVEPYVGVKLVNDTIFVVIIGEKDIENKTVKYTRRGNYWYSKLVYKPSSARLTNIASEYWIRNRFFYNDTIMEYTYWSANGRKSLEYLCFQTPRELLCLTDSDGFSCDSTITFEKLNKYGQEYVDSFEYYCNCPRYQKRYYHRYTKQIIDNSLLLSEKPISFGIDKDYIYPQEKLNSLGMFGVEMSRAGW